MKVIASEAERKEDEELNAIKQHIARSPTDFKLLVWSLFDTSSDDIHLLSRPFDLSAKAKLQNLPFILGGLRTLASNNATPESLDLPVSVLLHHMHPDERVGFEKAWEACRHGQQVECQVVDDLGNLDVLLVKDLVVVQQDDGDGMSRALVLLQYLIDHHNSMVKAVHSHGGTEPQAISLYQADPERIAECLLPWRKAKDWLRENILNLPQRKPQRMAILLEWCLRDWLEQTVPSLVIFSLDDWPRIQRVPAGVVRLPADEQAPALPPDWVLTIDDFFNQYGLLRDQVCLALDIFKKIALLAMSDSTKISPETPLQEKISAFVQKHPVSALKPSSNISPRLLDIFDPHTVPKKVCLRMKHLNALQDYLSNRIDAKVEDNLSITYRVPLSQQQLSHLSSINTKQTHPSFLLGMLLDLAERLQRNAYPPKQGIRLD